MQEVFIYTLTNPFTNQIYYVGQTVNMDKRVRQHDYFRKRSVVKMPIIEAVATCSKEERFTVEKFWINQFKAWGFPITNKIGLGIKVKKSQLVYKPLSKITEDHASEQEVIKKLGVTNKILHMMHKRGWIDIYVLNNNNFYSKTQIVELISSTAA